MKELKSVPHLLATLVVIIPSVAGSGEKVASILYWFWYFKKFGTL
jgi:hypothetical protein